MGTWVCRWCQREGGLGDPGLQLVSEASVVLGPVGRTVPRLQGLNQAAGTHLGANMQNVNPLGSDPHCPPPPCCAYSSGFAPGSEIR